MNERITITQSGPSLTEADIAQAEARLNRPIPKAYRDFLLQHNSGHPEPNAFRRPPDGEAVDSVSWFYGLNTGHYGTDLEWNLKEDQDRMPPEMFPIASVGGCQICLCTTGEDSGKVYFWDSESEDPDIAQPYYDNLYYLADSFEAFLDLLA